MPNIVSLITAWKTLKWNLRAAAGRDPRLFFWTYGLRPGLRSRCVTAETDIVIDGFPRSGNHFCTIAFLQSQPNSVKIAHHLHAPAQIIRAVKLGIPTIMPIRHPLDAVTSVKIRNPRLKPADVLRTWILFHNRIKSVSGHIIIADFNKIIEDFGEIIKAANQQYGTSFTTFCHNDQNVRTVFRRIDELGRHYLNGKHSEAKTSRPTEVKERLKPKVKALVTKEPLLKEAEKIYFALVCRDSGGL